MHPLVNSEKYRSFLLLLEDANGHYHGNLWSINIIRDQFNTIRCAKNSFQVQTNNEFSLQHRETKTPGQVNIFPLFGTLYPGYNVSGMPSDPIFFSLQSHLSHAKILLLNSGSVSLSWKCFSTLIFPCHHFAEWLQMDQGLSDRKHTGTLHSLLALFHLFLKIISTTAVS